MLAFLFGTSKSENGDFAIYLGASLVSGMAMLAQSVAIGWRVYEVSGSPLALSLIGLAQFIPRLLLSLPGGELCDRLSPRRVLAVGLLLKAICSAALLLLALAAPASIWPFYAVMALFGAARGLSDPAEQAVLPFLVPAERLPSAISWSSSIWQISVVAGPALGGLMYTLGPAVAYGFCCAVFLAAACGIAMLREGRTAPVVAAVPASRLERIKEGIRFVRSSPIILGAVSLDLFAVLFGGATALLPIYARDILHSGSVGLGLLQSAPSIGACLVAVYHIRRPVAGRSGAKLFAAVGIFGLATVVFGLSTWLPLSLAALLVLGASDMMSVNIRSSLVQLATPDSMRGRVSAVNMLFVGASAELGEFESGATAALLGTVPAAVLGGLGALLIVPVWMKLFPQLAAVDRLSDELACVNPQTAGQEACTI
jgi:MFS family permease